MQTRLAHKPLDRRNLHDFRWLNPFLAMRFASGKDPVLGRYGQILTRNGDFVVRSSLRGVLTPRFYMRRVI